MTKCPLCFVTLPADHGLWTALEGERKPDAVAREYYGAPVSLGPVLALTRTAGDRRTPAVEPTAAEAAKRLNGPVAELCPRCHYTLPDGWRAGHATCVATSGARETGKTVYVAVMIKTMQLFGERMGFVVEPNDQYTAEQFGRIYEKRLYEERQMVGPTPGLDMGGAPRDPLVFRIGVHGGAPRYLVIRDVAGEDLHRSENVGKKTMAFFGNADGVLHMFDPLKITGVANRLRDRVAVQEQHEVTPAAVLNTVLAMIGAGRPHLAVVLSKFDALHELRHLPDTRWGRIMANPGAAFCRDPSLRRTAYDEDDGAFLDAEVRSLLATFDEQRFVDAVAGARAGAPLPARFFAVSALGALPSGTQVHEGGISPFRCLDPVHWILKGAGIWN